MVVRFWEIEAAASSARSWQTAALKNDGAYLQLAL